MRATIRTLFVVAVLAAAHDSFAISQATMIFLTLPSSPQANGAAGVWMDGGEGDPLAVIVNPAVLGFASESNRMQSAFYTKPTRWLPSWDLEGLRYSARTLAIGFSPLEMKNYFDLKSRVSLGIAYSEVNLDLGTWERTDENGRSLGSFHSEENCKALSLGLGWHFEHWRFGAGFTHKYAVSELGPGDMGDAHAVASDFGLLAQWSGRQTLYDGAQDVHLFLTPTLSYSLLNVGSSVSYINDSPYLGDPLPRTATLSAAVMTGMSTMITSENPFNIITVGISTRADDELIIRDQYGRYEYMDNPFGQINPISNVLMGESDARVVVRKGFEISVLETITVRRGSYRDETDPRRDYDYTTEGWTVALGGALKLFGMKSLARFDVQLHHSELIAEDDPFSDNYWPIANTTYNGLTFVLRY